MNNENLDTLFDEKMNEILNSLKNNSSEESIILINDFLNKLKTKIDIDNEIHVFDNPIERILYSTTENYNPNTITTVPIHFLYYYLALAYTIENDYEAAIINLKKSLQINMYFGSAIFKIVECYQKLNDLDSMYNFILDQHSYLYNINQLSEFYRYLGDYYFDTKDYPFANTLYSYSEYYNSTSYNQQQLNKIAVLLSSNIDIEPINKIIPKLKEKEIPISISSNILNKLLKIYNVPTDGNAKRAIKEMTRKILYDLTKNESFAPVMYLRNNEIGFIFSIPDIWQVIDKTNYNKSATSDNTLFVIKPISKILINIEKLDFINNEDLKKKYFEYKQNYTNNGYNVLLESMVKINNINYIQVFIEQEILNESTIIVHNYISINGYVIDFNIPINEISFNKEKLLKDKNVTRINNILSTLTIINKTETAPKEEFTF